MFSINNRGAFSQYSLHVSQFHLQFAKQFAISLLSDVLVQNINAKLQWVMLLVYFELGGLLLANIVKLVNLEHRSITVWYNITGEYGVKKVRSVIYSTNTFRCETAGYLNIAVVFQLPWMGITDWIRSHGSPCIKFIVPIRIFCRDASGVVLMVALFESLGPPVNAYHVKCIWNKLVCYLCRGFSLSYWYVLIRIIINIATWVI